MIPTTQSAEFVRMVGHSDRTATADVTQAVPPSRIELNLPSILIGCPACGCAEVRKYGKTKDGRQRYRCLRVPCLRQFVAGSDHLIKPEVKALVLRLIKVRVPPSKIYEAFDWHDDLNPETGRTKISLRWIYKLRQRVLNEKTS